MAKKKHHHRPGRFDSMTAGISITMVLVLIGIVVFIVSIADTVGRTMRENFSVDVLLDDSMTTAQVQQMKHDLEARVYTKEVVFISKEEATKSMAEAYDDVNPQEFVGESPYPASFEISLKAEYTERDSLVRYMPPLKKMTGVTDVIYPEDLMTEVNDNIRKISLVLLIIAGLLSIVSIALINNTMRLNVSRRRHSIQTMKLVGATWGFISRPFLVKAFTIGLLASIIADGLIFLGIERLLAWDAEAATIISAEVIIFTLAVVALCGIMLTVISAWFSVRRHLSMSRDEAALY